LTKRRFTVYGSIKAGCGLRVEGLDFWANPEACLLYMLGGAGLRGQRTGVNSEVVQYVGAFGGLDAVIKAGSYVRLIDSCITQLKAQGPSRTCNESKEEGESPNPPPASPAARARNNLKGFNEFGLKNGSLSHTHT